METVTYQLTIPALLDTLPNINVFVEQHLSMYGCPTKTINQILLSVEEAYVNIVNYAYEDHQGFCKVVMQVRDGDGVGEKMDKMREMCIRLIDTGQPFDPLSKDDPDITLRAEERQIGGLGIYMIKKLMDEVSYERAVSENILTMKKQWRI